MKISGFAYDYFEKECSDKKEFMSDQFTKTTSDIAKETGYDWENTVYSNIKSGKYYFLSKPDSGQSPSVEDIKERNILDVIKEYILISEHNPSEYRYYIQAPLNPNEKLFYGDDRYLGKSLNMNFEPGFADLIMLSRDPDSNKVIIRVCDIKASLTMKLYHKIQVEIYCEIIESLLETNKELNKKCEVSEDGYVWARPAEHPDVFRRNPIKNFLREYFSEQTNGKTHESNELLYMSAAKCEGCIHADDCIKELITKKREILLSPNLTKRDAEYLTARGNNKLLSTHGIRCYEKSTPSLPKLKACSYMQRLAYNKQDRHSFLYLMDARKKAVQKQKMVTGTKHIRKNISIHPDIDFTKKPTEDIRFVFSVHYDQVSNTMPVLGLLIKYSKKALKKLDIETKNPDIEIFIAPSAVAVDNTIKAFTDKIVSVLNMVSEYNKEQEKNIDKLSIRGYTEDNLSRNNLEKTLFDYIDDPNAIQATVNNITRILTWIRNEKNLTLAPYVNASRIEKSVFAISEIVNELYILAAFIAYDLDTIAECFDVDHEQKDLEIFNRFNGNVRTPYMYELYHNKEANKQELKDRLKAALKQKLDLENKVLDAISLDMRSSINKPKVVRDDSVYYQSDIPDDLTESDIFQRMLYMLEYEDFLAERSIREPRLHGLEVGLARQNFIELTYVGKWEIGDRFSLPGSPNLQIKRASKKEVYYLCDTDHPVTLIENDEEDAFMSVIKSARYVFKTDANKLYKKTAFVIRGRFDELIPYWDDTEPNDNNVLKASGKFRWVKILDSNNKESRSQYIVLFSLPNNDKHKDKSSKNKKRDYNNCIAFPYHDRRNTDKLESFIKSMPNSRKQFLNGLLDYTPRPEEENPFIGGKKLFPDDGGDVFYDNVANTFDESKVEAYKKLKDNQVSVVIGPPGTGKTFFIVNTLKRLTQEHSDYPLRILVTSNSWAAIDNMLDSLRDIVSDELKGNIIRLSKALKEPEDISRIKENDKPVIVGSTCWQIRNNWFDKDGVFNATGDNNTLFDLVVIDEATQVNLYNSLMTMSVLNANGHLLLVGDEDQLGAIIQGEYDFSGNDENNLFGSVFSRYYRTFKTLVNGPVTQLNECRRMNEVMTRYLAEQIYDKKYTTVNINRFGRYDVQNECSSYLNSIPKEIKTIIDPDYQISLCIVKGDVGMIKEMKQAEIGLASEIAMALQLSAGIIEGVRTNTITFKDFWGTQLANEDDMQSTVNADDETDDTRYTDGMIGVVTPYNRFNDELTKAIADEYSPPKLEPELKEHFEVPDNCSEFIKCSTVDKFQGQERDFIIACYGEKDINSMLQIKGFIFNRNRLNVVISRAKKKIIIIMSEMICKRYKECYDQSDEDLVGGVEFICGLKNYLERDEPEKRDKYGGVFIKPNTTMPYSFRYKLETQDQKTRYIDIDVYQKGYKKA